MIKFMSLMRAKKNILKSNSFDVMQTVFFAFTCKFGLVLQVEKVVICINKTNWHPLQNPQIYILMSQVRRN